MTKNKGKALPKRGAASAAATPDEMQAKRRAFLDAVAVQADVVRAAISAEGANPASNEESKVAAVDSIHADFNDAPKEHIREALEKAIFEADANTLPPGAAAAVAGTATAGTGAASVDAAPQPPTVIKNDVIAHAPAAVADDPDADVDMVTANIPRAFKLRMDHSTQYAYNAGAQTMPRAHAEHWYAKAHGVTIVKNVGKTATRTK